MTTFSRFAAFLLALLLGSSVITTARAQLPVPNLTSLFPTGGQAGSTVEVAAAGVNLDEGDRIVFSHPGITTQPKQLPPDDFHSQPRKVPNEFVVTIAGDVPPGLYEARHVGRLGASNPRTFAVGRLPEVMKTGDIGHPSRAQDVNVGVVINSRFDNNNYHYYSVTLKAGERVLLDCQAQRIDSKANATLLVLDPAGQELARTLDTIGTDPVLDFTAPRDGRFIVAVYDFVFNGGPDYGYRLTIASRPFIDFVFPPAGTPGSNNTYTLYGRNLPGGQPGDGMRIGNSPLQKITVQIPVPADPAQLTSPALTGVNCLRAMLVDSVEFKWSQGPVAANPVSIGIAAAPVIVEQEPNNRPEQSQKISWPCDFAGQFYPQRDEDWVQFDLAKDDTVDIEVIAHRLGLTCDPVMIIQRVRKNDKGEEQTEDVAQVDDPAERNANIGREFDTSTDDPSYRLRAPENATYRLMIRDQFGDSRVDPRFVYRLVIKRPEPGFIAVAFPDIAVPNRQNNQITIDNLSVPRGGSVMLQVVTERFDFDGDIELQAENLPAGVTCSGCVLGGQAKRGLLVITADEKAAGWTGSVRMVAKATINGQQISRPVRAGTTVWGSQNNDNDPARFRVLRDVVLSVTDSEETPVAVRAGEGQLMETALGGKIELPVTVKRSGQVKDPLRLSLLGFVKEVKGKDLSLDNSKNDGKFEFELNQANIKPGTYTFCLRADSKLGYVRGTELVAAAEAELKQVSEALQKFQDQQKQAEQNRDAESSKLKDARNQLKEFEKQRDAIKPDDPARKDAEARVATQQALIPTLEAAFATAEKLPKELAEKNKAGTTLRQQVEQRLNEAKKNAQPKDLALSVISNPVKLRIHKSPVKLELPELLGSVKAGEKIELAIPVTRSFGFSDVVAISVTPPDNVPGLPKPNANLPGDQQQAKLEFATQKNAPPGEYPVVIKAKGKFGNVNFESEGTAKVRIEPAG